MSDRWETTDRTLHFTHNFTDVRAKIEVKYDGQVVENNTIPKFEAYWKTGQNLVRNITDLGSTEE